MNISATRQACTGRRPPLGYGIQFFDELKAATYEDVGEAKSYWLVWDCDGYTLAAECYDQFDGKETPQETSVTSIYVFRMLTNRNIFISMQNSIVDGYVGSGSAPLCLSGIKTVNKKSARK